MEEPKRISDHAEGYVRISVDGKPVLYHRWLIEQLLGVDLLPDEHVHHINGDRQDNRIENLEILSKSEHARLHMSTGVPTTDIKCPICGIWFERPNYKVRYAEKTGITLTCSRECAPHVNH